jgi:hypothetical protein
MVEMKNKTRNGQVIKKRQLTLHGVDPDDTVVIVNDKFDMRIKNSKANDSKGIIYHYEGTLDINSVNKTLVFKYTSGIANYGVDDNYDVIEHNITDLPIITVNYDEIKEKNIICEGNYCLSRVKWLCNVSPVFNVADITTFYVVDDSTSADNYIHCPSINIMSVPNNPFTVHLCPQHNDYNKDEIRQCIDSMTTWQDCQDLYPILIPLMADEVDLLNQYCQLVDKIYVSSGMEAEHQRRMRRKFAMLRRL